MKMEFRDLRELEDMLESHSEGALERGDWRMAGDVATAAKLLVAFRTGNLQVVDTPMRAFVDDADQAAHEAQRAASSSTPEKKAKPEGAHRHVWGETNGAPVCVAVDGCTAKPRKKKEAPVAAEGGSL